MAKKILIISMLLLAPTICFGAAATMYTTVAGAGNKDGTDWTNAFGLAEWETDLEGNAEAGDIYYVAGGTYTLTAHLDCANDGTSVAPISVIGVESGTTNEPPVLSDYAYGTDRPLIASGAYACQFDDYWVLKNIRVTITFAQGFKADDGSALVNCYAFNSSGTSNYPGFQLGQPRSSIIGCEAISTNGYAIQLVNSSARIVSVYIHDSTVGISGVFNSANISKNIIDTCTTGIAMNGSGLGSSVINNTFYTCTTGITGTTDYAMVFLNNILDECGTPASWGTEEKSNLWDYNSWDGDKSSNSNVTAGLNSIDSDITLTDPANGDFTLGSGSACIDAGLQVGTNQGAVGDYKVNIGADQDDVAAAGGVGGAGFMVIY